MRVLPSVLVVLGVACYARVAFAEPRPLGAEDLAVLRKPRNAWEALVQNFVVLQERQRRGPAARLIVPPFETGTGRKWLPEGPVGLPPAGMAVGPLPYRALDIAPVISGTANTIVATGRSNEGMVEAFTAGLPWLLP